MFECRSQIVEVRLLLADRLGLLESRSKAVTL